MKAMAQRLAGRGCNVMMPATNQRVTLEEGEISA